MKLSKQNYQVIQLYSTTILGVFLGVISSIINTRFVDPVTYGDVRYIQNILNFMASLLLFGYFQSGSRLLALSRNSEESREIKGCMVLILCICSLILILGCVFCAILHIDKNHLSYLFFVSIPVCISPLLINYINTTAQGDNSISLISYARLLPALIYVPVAYFYFKYLGASATKMILLQWGISTLILLFILYSTRPSFKNLRKSWFALNSENKVYGIQLYIGSLVMVATNYIAGISLGYFSSDNSEVGFYTLALTITMPLQMLPSIIGTTYFKQFASVDRIPPKVMRTTFWLTIISCIVFSILITPLVLCLYSERYSVVANYAVVLSIGFCMHGFGDMINRYLGSHGKGKCIRNASIANGVFKVIGYTVLVYYLNTMGALITTVVSDAIYLITLLYYYRIFVNNPDLAK